MRRSVPATALPGLLPVVFALAGCVSAPPADLPRVELPTTFKTSLGDAYGLAGQSARSPGSQWWKIYAESKLDELQEALLEQSPDLAAALARHDQVQAIARGVRAAELPTVGTNLSAQRLQQSELRPLRVLGPNSPDRYSSGTAQLDASYELDLWGRIRQRVAAGEADARASEADLQGARLSLQAQLADSWLALRGADGDLQLLKETLEALEKAVALTTSRHQQGVASGFDVARAQGQLASVRSQQAQAVARRAQLENAIAVLVGANPSSFRIATTSGESPMPRIPAGVPAELLRRRPDVRAAQQRVEAAAASVGVAKAAYFPTVMLSAQGGFQSSDFARFIEAPNLFWALGPGLVTTLFDGGRRAADQARAEAVLDEAGQRYRSVVLGAFQQVEDQLTVLAQFAEAANQEQEAAGSATRALGMALSRYQGGAASFLDVVAAQSAQLQARRSELDLITRQRRASVQLIRALGGSWTSERVAGAAILGSK